MFRNLIFLQDQRGNTPLHSAVNGSHADIINLLLQNKADTEIANNEGQVFRNIVSKFLFCINGVKFFKRFLIL